MPYPGIDQWRWKGKIRVIYSSQQCLEIIIPSSESLCTMARRTRKRLFKLLSEPNSQCHPYSSTENKNVGQG